MIKQIEKKHIDECAEVIRESFLTVAEEFNITKENAPRYVAFAIDNNKLSQQLENGTEIYAYFIDGNVAGVYSLSKYQNECEISNLCVLPKYRHRGIGKALLVYAFNRAKELDCQRITISIVAENKVLKSWYEKYGFVTTHTKKYDFFPFTCEYMEKVINHKVPT